MVQIEAISVPTQNVLVIYFISTGIFLRFFFFLETIVSCEILYGCVAGGVPNRYSDNKKKTIDKTRIHFKRWMSVQSQNRK